MDTSFSYIFLHIYLVHINLDIKIIQEKDKNDNEYCKINIKKEGEKVHTFELKIDGDNIEEVLEKIKVIK